MPHRCRGSNVDERRKAHQSNCYALVATKRSFHIIILKRRGLSALFFALTLLQFGQSLAQGNTTEPIPTPPPSTSPDDFAKLNLVLNDIKVAIPDASLIREVVDLKMRNVVCTNFRVDDLVVESYKVDSTSNKNLGRTNVRLKIVGLDAFCQADYEYIFLLFPIAGKADFFLNDNLVTVSMVFDSPNTVYPKNVTITDCSPEIKISNIEFYGDVTAVVWETVEGLIRDYVETATNKKICESVAAFTSMFLTDILVTSDDVIQGYYVMGTDDPLLLETTIEIPHDSVVLDLQDRTKSQWQLFDDLLSTAVSFARNPVDNGFGQEEANINLIIRENVLDGEHAYRIKNIERELFQFQSEQSSVSIILHGVKIFGLDTIISFEPLDIIGRYTVQNKLAWDRLSFELDLTLDVTPVSEEGPTAEGVVTVDSISNIGAKERIKMVLGAENVEAVASILMVVDKQKLGSLTLGSFLASDSIIHCLFSVFEEARLSGLSLNAVDLVTPVLEGFVSPGLDRVVTKSVDIAYDLYESTLLAIAPVIFDTTFKQFTNDRWLDKNSSSAVTGRECPTQNVTVSPDGFIDFRDLLLPPDQALSLGGTGEQPYGDIVYGIVSRFKNELTSDDAEGSPGINNVLRSSTSRSSELSTGASFNIGDVLDWKTVLAASGLRASVNVKILNVEVHNVDSFASPLVLLEPILGQPHELNNSATIGVGPHPVSLTTRLSFIVSDGADFTFNNIVSLRIEMSVAQLGLITGVKIREEKLFSTSVNDALDPFCWAAKSLSKPEELIDDFTWEQTFSVDDLNLNVTCIECSSPNFEELIYYLYNPEESATRVKNILNILRDNDAALFVLEAAFSEIESECNRADGNRTFLSDVQTGTETETELPPSKRDKTFLYFNMANIVITVSFFSAFFLGRLLVKSRQRAWMSTLPDEAIERLRRREALDMAKETVMNETTESMFSSPQLSFQVRVSVPLLLIATIGIQIVGHLAILSTVDLVGHIAGEPYSVTNFFFFSIISITERAYRNGGIEMALLLVLFTVLWPYIKLITCLMVWFIPPRIISVSRRGAILHWVDVFARLSIVDIATMLILVALILVFINDTSKEDDTVSNLFSTTVVVVPKGGFYCLIIAQRIARASARYLLDCHHHIIASTVIQRVRRNNSDEEELSIGSIIDNESEKGQSNASTSTASTNSLQKSDDENAVDSPHVNSGSFEHGESIVGAFGDSGDKIAQRFHWIQMDNGSREAFEVTINVAESTVDQIYAKDDLQRRDTQIQFWRKLATGLTIFTVVIIGLIGCVLAPSIAVDAQPVWDMFQTGKSFEQVVRDYHFFRVEYLVLTNGRFILDSTAEKIGLLCLFLAGAIAIVAFPMLKVIVAFRSLVLQHEKSINFGSVGRTLLRFLIAIPLQIRDWLKFLYGGPISFSRADNDLDLLPAYRLIAWDHLEVYVLAFVIACWQLGAILSYTIYTYCFVLESSYKWLAYLGLVENSSAGCFRLQSQSLYSVVILATTTSVLFLLFFLEAKGKYRKVMSEAAKNLRDNT